MLRNNPPSNRFFKYKDLKVYASTEWLADNRKKFRQVFERYETNYIYVELSFYNKLFDVEDWEAEIVLRCMQIGKRNSKDLKEVCTLPLQRKVSRHENIYHVREGWGAKKLGVFWKKGTYIWEALVDGEKVGECQFYIEDAGKQTDDRAPLLAVQNIKFYEGPADDVVPADRRYVHTFHGEETRYIHFELDISNAYPARNWNCELFFKVYTASSELKGQISTLQMVDRTQDVFTVTAGLGTNVKGSWRYGEYTLDVIFLDKVVATLGFEVGEAFKEEADSAFTAFAESDILDMFNDSKYFPSTEIGEVSSEDLMNFETLMVDMDALIGLTAIKKKVREHAQYIQFLQLRRRKGFNENEPINIHSVFYGNPGTGKTTVAKMMGELYKNMGLLTNGHVHEVDRVDLVGEYIGQTAPKVKEAIEKARGGVLFIDEAYSLARASDDSKDFGREVIEILLKEMSDGEGDIAVVVAGYPKEMQQFLDSNPGLKSRFKLKFEFPDYLPQELAQIAEYACARKSVKLSLEAKRHLSRIITDTFRRRDRSFGNARFVFDLVEEAKMNLGLRVMNEDEPNDLDNETLEFIEYQDVETINVLRNKDVPFIPIDDPALGESLSELDGLIGMNQIKIQIHELVKLVRFHRETEKGVLNKFFLHTVFVGNPGTGKTTVARILTKIYKALGILERGHMVETDRQGLVAGFIGQTAIKTAEKIDEAIGGVLFIDEAYALSPHGNASGDYGSEAIQTLLKRMEDQRGEFFVFVAGYPDNMDGFMKVNPGLRSRFDKVLKFEDYTATELFDIALQMVRDEDLALTAEASKHVHRYLEFQYDYRDNYFGNARLVRNIITEVVKNQNLRLATLAKIERTSDMIAVITIDDVQHLRLDKDSDSLSNKKTIGFQKKIAATGGSASDENG